MATSTFPCGCMITWSMFGEREVLSVHMCVFHAQAIADQGHEFVKVLTEAIHRDPHPIEEEE